jgi:hypothetical protein
MALALQALGVAGFVAVTVWNIVRLWGRVEQVARRVDDAVRLLRNHITLDDLAGKNSALSEVTRLAGFARWLHQAAIGNRPDLADAIIESRWDDLAGQYLKER